MATATETERRVDWESVNERWHMLMTDSARFAGEDGIGQVNSKRWTKIQRTLEELAGRMVDEVHPSEFDGEAASLQVLTQNIWHEIGRQIIEWAETIEAERASRQGP